MLETSTAVEGSDQLLAAIFRATRSAKRFRDAASACYGAGAHQFAGANRRKKEELYELKDRGIVTATRSGLIQAVATQGPLTVFRGGGYCFHSLLRPSGIVLENISDEPLLVEAKPAERHEMRLRDAKALLRELVADNEGFTRLSFPSRASRGWRSPERSGRYYFFGDRDEYAEACYGHDEDMDDEDMDDEDWDDEDEDEDEDDSWW